jgi:hypothetical protein
MYYHNITKYHYKISLTLCHKPNIFEDNFIGKPILFEKNAIHGIEEFYGIIVIDLVILLQVTPKNAFVERPVSRRVKLYI